MDPQQRLVLERGYEALHISKMGRAMLLDSLTGIFVGISFTAFEEALNASPIGATVYAATGSSHAVASGRLAYVLGTHGPCLTIDTACSSSLVGSHSSIRALQRHECPAALSSGVNMLLDARVMLGNSIAGFTSATGASHTFDIRADGYARGEAIDTTVCRRAVSTLTSVRMVGSAIRQDGRSASLTAPNGSAQRRLFTAALEATGEAPSAMLRIDQSGETFHGELTRAVGAIALDGVTTEIAGEVREHGAGSASPQHLPRHHHRAVDVDGHHTPPVLKRVVEQT